MVIDKKAEVMILHIRDLRLLLIKDKELPDDTRHVFNSLLEAFDNSVITYQDHPELTMLLYYTIKLIMKGKYELFLQGIKSLYEILGEGTQ